MIDRSGSMYEEIESAKKALTIFLKSLPKDSYFNVISFGSLFELMFPESIKITEASLKTALEVINTLNIILIKLFVFSKFQT